VQDDHSKSQPIDDTLSLKRLCKLVSSVVVIRFRVLHQFFTHRHTKVNVLAYVRPNIINSNIGTVREKNSLERGLKSGLPLWPSGLSHWPRCTRARVRSPCG